MRRCRIVLKIFLSITIGVMFSYVPPSLAEEGVPKITDLMIDGVEADLMTEVTRLNADDLDDRSIVISGRAEVPEGELESVFVSFDGGSSWNEVVVDPLGKFSVRFQPALDRIYEWSVKAVSTTGKVSDTADDVYVFIVKSITGEEEAAMVFKELLKHYMDENRFAFMELVSEDFEGDLDALEDAIQDDFRFFNNIIIRPSITRTIGQDNEYEVNFIFYRRVQSANSGEIFTDNAATTMNFRTEEGGVKLISMAAPLIFGLSNVAEVATSVDNDAVGDQVIVVDPNTGRVTKVEQLQTVEETMTGDVRLGTATLRCTYVYPPGAAGTGQGFTFLSQSVSVATTVAVFNATATADFTPYIGAVAGTPAVFSTGGSTEVIELGAGSLNSVNSVPSEADGGYSSSDPSSGTTVGMAEGNLYAIWTGSVYAVIRVSSLVATWGAGVGNLTMTFEYKIQMSGTNQF
jgi:hypothetical protein